MYHFAGSLWHAGWMLPTRRSCRRGWGRRRKNRAAGFLIHIPGQTTAPQHAGGGGWRGELSGWKGAMYRAGTWWTSKVLWGEP